MADETSGLQLPVNNGKVDPSVTNKTSTKKTGSDMGKDEFLQLLVAQMKYQDPLAPTDNTQYVSQLAQFSSLEQMQNLNQTTLNTQAFALVGQEVIMQTTDASGKATLMQGTVDFVSLNNNKAYFSIEGKLYPADNLYSLVGAYYVASQNAPTVKQTALSYDHKDPKDQYVEITLGKDEYQASKVAVFIKGVAVDAEDMEYLPNEGKVLIRKEAFQKLDEGTYGITFMFNDPLGTTITDRVSVKITGEKPDLPPEEEKPEEPEEKPEE